MIPARSFSTFGIVFAAVFAVVYVIAAENNYALITYHPAIGEWGAGVEKPREGPAMYWYGWLSTSTIIATLAGFVAAWLPEGIGRRLWPGLSWAVPVGTMFAFCYLLREFFLR
jgi:hypothetical protein